MDQPTFPKQIPSCLLAVQHMVHSRVRRVPYPMHNSAEVLLHSLSAHHQLLAALLHYFDLTRDLAEVQATKYAIRCSIACKRPLLDSVTADICLSVCLLPVKKVRCRPIVPRCASVYNVTLDAAIVFRQANFAGVQLRQFHTPSLRCISVCFDRPVHVSSCVTLEFLVF